MHLFPSPPFLPFLLQGRRDPCVGRRGKGAQDACCDQDEGHKLSRQRWSPLTFFFFFSGFSSYVALIFLFFCYFSFYGLGLLSRTHRFEFFCSVCPTLFFLLTLCYFLLSLCLLLFFMMSSLYLMCARFFFLFFFLRPRRWHRETFGVLFGGFRGTVLVFLVAFSLPLPATLSVSPFGHLFLGALPLRSSPFLVMLSSSPFFPVPRSLRYVTLNFLAFLGF